jgi:hypothetical protein
MQKKKVRFDSIDDYVEQEDKKEIKRRQFQKNEKAINALLKKMQFNELERYLEEYD